ncbi:MAG: NAD(+)/NADH kinase [Bdellovibrionota bacterium]
MKVLVVRKRTSLDLFGEYVRKKVSDELMAEESLLKMQRSHFEHSQALALLHDSLDKEKIAYEDVSHGQYWPETESFDAVIAVGGDGTVLDASHHIDQEDTSIIGIRSSPGSVGHLCYCGREQIESAIKALKSKKLKFAKVIRLKAKIHSLNSQADLLTSPILNDFLFCNESPAATTHYQITFREHSERQKSSGIWISTPAGSSAAMKAAGGQLMSPECEEFQFIVRELYQPPEGKHGIVGGVFDPDVDLLSIENLCDRAVLALDGHHRLHRLSYGDRLSFMRGPSLSLARR